MEITMFPKTPHLVWFGDKLKDDKLLTKAEQKQFLSKPVIVQEKVDGNCIGFAFDNDATAYISHREGLVDRDDSAFYKLHQWHAEHEDALFDLCSNRYTLFGEWLFLRHTVAYSRLPSYYLVHDIFDRKHSHFLPTKKVARMAKEHGFSHNPIVYEGKATLDELVDLTKSQSQFSDSQREGIYLRVDDAKQNLYRAKIVNEAFHKQVSKTGHWRNQDQYVRNVSMHPQESHLAPYKKSN
ncbi:MAG TPA: RNA ligase family protein [Acidobacteriota bacterium]|nr:RNA ligase family protein [Acidobacteriota bacterium]